MSKEGAVRTGLVDLGQYDMFLVDAGVAVQGGSQVVHGGGRRQLHADPHLPWLLVHVHHLKHS